MVHIEEHLLIAKTRSLHERALEVHQVVLSSRRVGIENIDDAVCVLHDGTPCLLISPVTRHIPELDVDFAKNACRGWRISLQLKDSDQKKKWLTSLSAYAASTYLTPTVGL